MPAGWPGTKSMSIAHGTSNSVASSSLITCNQLTYVFRRDLPQGSASVLPVKNLSTGPRFFAPVPISRTSVTFPIFLKCGRVCWAMKNLTSDCYPHGCLPTPRDETHVGSGSRYPSLVTPHRCGRLSDRDQADKSTIRRVSTNGYTAARVPVRLSGHRRHPQPARLQRRL